MAYATLMVHVDMDDVSEKRIRLAEGLSNRFKALLIGVGGWARRPPLIYGGVIAGAEMSQIDFENIAERLEQRGEHFKAITVRQPRVEWRSEIDFPTDVLAREARAADLVIIGQDRPPDDLYRSLDPGGALLKTGRPVLVAPNTVDTLNAERIVIAWKDTRETRRAVQDSLPFLHEAKRLSIVAACEEGGESEIRRQVDDVEHYLTRHRLSVAAKIVVHTKGPVADELIRVAKEENADLIVAGAYGRSRLGEWIFGGVTRDLLKRAPVCCLFSH